MTDWMREQVDVNEWTKGRLVCPTDGCHQRIGSFDFINGHKCRCRSYVLPNIQIIKSRVDKQMAKNIA
ncbi:unnamed protein product [Oppiella nova]|uniref:Uncharacterized protein n=1 Tax=Oppiella nova TaxID=334625 RepID=A0A7R9QDW4_9ACAR|nr:unnamed protein product [Oppiella nova]CAG2163833.1 unnamed protein product [Oppiella nova]